MSSEDSKMVNDERSCCCHQSTVRHKRTHGPLLPTGITLQAIMKNNTPQKSVALCEHGGGIVPVLTGFSELEVQRLREASVELLNLPEGKHLVYTKEYTEEEQHANLGGDDLDFHPGYDLVSFFVAFPELVRWLEQGTVTEFAPFLTPDELAVLRPEG
eukprot:jgi/Psemu1/284878/fgenesh1_pg.67_\